MTRLLRLLSVLGVLTALAGCASPCDSYCDAAANYIEVCLATSTQGDWQAAKDRGGWTTWNVSEKAEYVSTCKADFANQLASGNDVVQSECTDLANRFQENADRGFCVELP